MAKTLITGGCGFLGRKLAERLVADRPDIDLVLADQAAPPADWKLNHDWLDHARLDLLSGDVADRSFIDEMMTDDVETVFHLASVVSAGAEQDFDLGYAVNLLGTIGLLERCREVGTTTGRAPTVVFPSSLAAYGSGAGNPVVDATALRPETSYGVQKATAELLLNDYHRKGFIDGRGLRLPTVVVRPGKPNLAASGFASGIVREPLQGIDTVCPVSAGTVMAVISPRRVIDAFVRLVELDSAELGADRTVPLPGLAMSMSQAIEATRAEAGDRRLGTVAFVPDPDVQRIIDSWPPSIVAERAEVLGLVGDRSVAAIVRQHIEDELGGLNST